MSDKHHGSYYVPPHSQWPIIGAIGLFLLGLGSINIFSGGISGPILFISGIVVLIYMFIGWMADIIKESRAGLYDEQMLRTFRWGMFWFIFTDAAIFLAFLSALWYFRIFTLAWLSYSGTATVLDTGMTHLLLWPNFHATWPLTINPDPSLFPGPQQALSLWGIPTLNILLMISSALTLLLAYAGVKKNNHLLLMSGLLTTMVLGILFVIFQIIEYYLALTQYLITWNTGIYASTALILILIHLLHVITGLIILSVITVRAALKHFNSEHYFAIQATVWFWMLITIAWICTFFSIYV